MYKKKMLATLVNHPQGNRPHAFQIKAVASILKQYQNPDTEPPAYLVNADTGHGKSLILLGACQAIRSLNLPETPRFLIIVEPSVKAALMEQAKTWVQLNDLEVFDFSEEHRHLREKKFKEALADPTKVYYVISPGLLTSHSDLIQGVKWSLIGGDETASWGKPGSQRFCALKGLLDGPQNAKTLVVFLTATHSESSLLSLAKLCFRIKVPVKGKVIPKDLRPYVLSVRQGDEEASGISVGEMRERQLTDVALTQNEASAYRAYVVKQEATAHYEEALNAVKMAQLMTVTPRPSDMEKVLKPHRSKKACQLKGIQLPYGPSAYMQAVIDEICSLRAAGKKVVVACAHNVVMDELAVRLVNTDGVTMNVARFNGHIPMSERKALLQAAANPNPIANLQLHVLLVNMRSAGRGLNLQGYHLIYAELPLSPQTRHQMDGRVYRQGCGDVEIITPLAPGTIQNILLAYTEYRGEPRRGGRRIGETMLKEAVALLKDLPPASRTDVPVQAIPTFTEEAEEEHSSDDEEYFEADESSNNEIDKVAEYLSALPKVKLLKLASEHDMPKAEHNALKRALKADVTRSVLEFMQSINWRPPSDQ